MLQGRPLDLLLAPNPADSTIVFLSCPGPAPVPSQNSPRTSTVLSPSPCAWGFLAVNVLGILGLYHDSAACLVVDGAIVVAAQEERLLIRHDPSSFNAIQACLDKAKIGAADLDMVVFMKSL